MIKIFGITDKDYSTNGDIVVAPLKAKIHKEDNGEYYLELEADLKYIEYIVPNNIVVANTPTGSQPFRIANVENTKYKIKAKAWHIFYDTKNYLIADSYVVEKNCNDALDHLNNAVDNESPFTTTSNITKINSYRCVRKSLYEAIQTVIERWGGHLVRNGYNIGIRETIGQDNGVTIRYAKNLKEITCEYNWDEVVTKLMPVGKDGLLLEEEYVYSDTQYQIPYTKTVSFSQDQIVEDDYETQDEYMQALITDLRNQAKEYVNKYSIPQVNYSLSANIEKITDVGDTIEVIDERLNVNILTQVIAYDYDCILERYTSVEFGNFQKKLSDLPGAINKAIENSINENNGVLKVTLGEELEKATAMIREAMSSSYVIYDGDKILIVDRLPKEEAQNVIMLNSGGIGFSQTGINGTFQSAWTIDNVLNMEQINVINLTADLIKGGTFKLGSNLNQYGQLEVYDEANTLIAELNKNGLKMYGNDGSYVLINTEVGFAGYDHNNVKIYWADGDKFHMRKAEVEEEITLCAKIRFIPITITENGNVVNDGLGIVSVLEGG